MKAITIVRLKKLNACKEAVNWVSSQKNKEIEPLFDTFLAEEKPLGWGNWLIARLLPKTDKIRYAIYAASEVLEIYEKKYPNDKRPREAIKAAKRYLKSPTKKNKAAADAAGAAAGAAADAAADASYAASYASYAAAAADAASYASYASYAAAADAASYASYASYAAAADAAAAAADAAAGAAAAAADAAAAKKQMQIKTLKYGVKLLLK